MSISEYQLRGVADPRLALHATSPLPAWLFSIDGSQVLWANPPAVRAFGADNAVTLAERTYGPADLHRRQVLQLARRLPPNGMPRLERLRGFGAGLGMLVTCGCTRLDFADGSEAVLVAATEATGRAMPLIERLQRLIDGNDMPIAVFARDGLFVGASDAARKLLGFRDLAEAGLEQARHDALAAGHVEMPIDIGQMNLHMILQRVGSGADIALLAFLVPQAAQQPPEMEAEAETDAAAADTSETADTGHEQAASVAWDEPPVSDTAAAEIELVDEFAQAAPAPVTVAPEEPPEAVEQPMPEYEQPAQTGEAPAEFALLDEFIEADTPPAPCAGDVEPTAVDTAMQDAPRAAADHAADATDSPPADLVSADVSADVDVAAPEPRRHPLRFTWRIDARDRFALASDDFIGLIGPGIAAGLGGAWPDIARHFPPESAARIADALATRHTWSGIAVDWPVDGGESLPVELSGLPVYDRLRDFAGYRGFGVCRDLQALTEVAARRRSETKTETEPARPDPAVQSPVVEAVEPTQSGQTPAAVPPVDHTHDSALQPNDLEKPVETPGNVVPFRPIGEQRISTLTPIENHAFDEIARQLSARLENDDEEAGASGLSAGPDLAEPPPVAEPPRPQPEWLTPPEPPALGESRRDRTLLDLLPTGILIYRLDRLLYANPAFLQTIGHDSLHALEQAGGLDALYVEVGLSGASSTSETGTPVKISAAEAADSTDARLHAISWDDENALALILSPKLAPEPVATVVAESIVADPPSEVGHANAEELGAILDTTAEGIIMFDSGGNIHACNRSAEALFGYDGAELVQRNLIELFAPESKSMVVDYLEGIKGAGVESLLDHGREVLGRVAKGGIIPLAMTMGRTRSDGPNFFAVFRDLSQSRKGENELQQARKLADRAANAKADLLAKISHEIRTPLSAIIGFAEVMLGERFGALGNERYLEYMKDIRSSGERVTTIINDLLELSRIETGKLNLAFTNQNLNELVESCVGAMQSQANRDRIIIRTSLAQALPSVVADTRALRQIAMNLIGSSLQLANAGGQVIVSTALSDFGEVVLRVRDTGHGLNDSELAAALEPFRSQTPSDQAEGSAVSLSLTKALVEANRAQFNIRSAPHTGTMIEVVFPHALARAQ